MLEKYHRDDEHLGSGLVVAVAALVDGCCAHESGRHNGQAGQDLSEGDHFTN